MKYFFLLIFSLLFISCQPEKKPQKYEYLVMHFSRDESSTFNSKLETLGKNGWNLKGTLANNGINARFIVFQRPLKEKEEESTP
ncbi:MAG: hypothetical protein ACQES9_08045 [Myxococcota bacterium]